MRAALMLVAVTLRAWAQPAPVDVVIETDAGIIEATIDVARAPVTAANFLHYVDTGFYEGGFFYRTVKADNQPNNQVKIEVIQGGADPHSGLPVAPPIPLERTSQTGLRHTDGTLSMARSGPDSATSEFFICIADQPSLDFGGQRNPDGQGFAAFGKVTRGMDVVRKIQQGPAEGQSLKPPIKILRIRRK
jgi:peptidyl-prolyl cis-trans isomerase A (cyclophilin A)